LAAAVAVCAVVEGLPLGIELAAARLAATPGRPWWRPGGITRARKRLGAVGETLDALGQAYLRERIPHFLLGGCGFVSERQVVPDCSLDEEERLVEVGDSGAQRGERPVIDVVSVHVHGPGSQ